MRRRLAFLLVLVLLATTLAGCATNETAAEPASIVDAKIDENGNLILFMSSGTTINAGYVRGMQGEDGVDGIDGVNGDSIASAYVDEYGDLQLQLSDDRVVNAGHVQGADGRNGRDGADGQDGRDGKDGEDGEDGRDGVDGKDGQDGKDGLNGQDGEDGEDGKDGITPTIGDNGNWWIGDTDTGVQAGAGEEFIFDQEGKGTVLLAYVGSDAEVVIPEKCTQIAAGAFANNRIITSVVIPDSVTSIGEHAFDTCANLTSVKLPNNPNFTDIPNFAFNACALREISLPDSVDFIGDYAFHSNPYLTKAQYSEQVRWIGAWAFADCSLSEVIIPSARVKEYAFANCSDESYRYPDSEVKGEHTFTSLVIPEGMSPDGTGIFMSCDKLTSVTWEGLSNNYGQLNILPGMFSYCVSLTDLKLPNDLSDLSVGEHAFAGTAIETAYIGSQVGADAFSNCKKIKNIVQIGSGDVSKPVVIGERAFSGCTQLKDFKLNNTIEHRVHSIEIKEGAFEDSGVINVSLAASDTISIQVMGLLSFSEEVAECLTLNARSVDLGEYGLSLCEFRDVTINADHLTCGDENGILTESDNAIQTLTLNVKYLHAWMYRNGFPELQTLALPAGIRVEGFGHCPKLNTVILKDVSGFGDTQTTFETAVNIPELVCMSDTPLYIDADLDNVGVIYVPDEAVEVYKAAESWSEYAEKIRPESTRKPMKEATIVRVTSEDVKSYIVGYKIYLDFPREKNTDSEFSIYFADENGNSFPDGTIIYPQTGLSFTELSPGILNESRASFHLEEGYNSSGNIGFSDIRFILETEDTLYAVENAEIIIREYVNNDKPENPNDPNGIYFTETSKTISVGQTYAPKIMGVATQTILTPSRLYVNTSSLGIIDITEDNQVIGLKEGIAYIQADYSFKELQGSNEITKTYTTASMRIIVQEGNENISIMGAESLSDNVEITFQPGSNRIETTNYYVNSEEVRKLHFKLKLTDEEGNPFPDGSILTTTSTDLKVLENGAPVEQLTMKDSMAEFQYDLTTGEVPQGLYVEEIFIDAAGVQYEFDLDVAFGWYDDTIVQNVESVSGQLPVTYNQDRRDADFNIDETYQGDLENEILKITFADENGNPFPEGTMICLTQAPQGGELSTDLKLMDGDKEATTSIPLQDSAAYYKIGLIDDSPNFGFSVGFTIQTANKTYQSQWNNFNFYVE